MKWLNHAIVTGCLVYGFTGGNFVSTLAAMAGGLFPDTLEGRPPEDKNKLKKWRAMHRGLSHWFVPYAVVAAIMMAPSVFHLPRGTPRHVLSSPRLFCPRVSFPYRRRRPLRSCSFA